MNEVDYMRRQYGEDNSSKRMTFTIDRHMDGYMHGITSAIHACYASLELNLFLRRRHTVDLHLHILMHS